MAFFGLPGGAEWLLIIGIILMLFVPGVLLFWVGYFTGKKAATKESSPITFDTSEASGASPATHYSGVLSDDTDARDNDA